MGMTDRQFDVYLEGLLRDLRRIAKEFERDGKSETLEELTKDTEGQLQRP